MKRHLRFIGMIILFIALPSLAVILGVDEWLNHEHMQRQHNLLARAESVLVEVRDRITLSTAQQEIGESLADELRRLPQLNDPAIIALQKERNSRWPGLIELRVFSVSELDGETPWLSLRTKMISGLKAGSGQQNQLAQYLVRSAVYDHERLRLQRNRKWKEGPSGDRPSLAKLVQNRLLGSEVKPELLAGHRGKVTDLMTYQGARSLFWEILESDQSGPRRLVPRALVTVVFNPVKYAEYFSPERIVGQEKDRLQLEMPGLQLSLIHRDKDRTDGLTKEQLERVGHLTPVKITRPDGQTIALQLARGDDSLVVVSLQDQDVFPGEAQIRLQVQIAVYLVLAVATILSAGVYYGFVDVFISLRLQVASLFFLAVMLPIAAILFGGLEYINVSRISLEEQAYERLRLEVLGVDEMAQTYLNDIQQRSRNVIRKDVPRAVVEGDGGMPAEDVAATLETALKKHVGYSTNGLMTDWFLFDRTGELLLTSNPGYRKEGRTIEKMLMGTLAQRILTFATTGQMTSDDSKKTGKKAGLENEFLGVILNRSEVTERAVKNYGLIYNIQIFGNNLYFLANPLWDEAGKSRYAMVFTYVMDRRYRDLVEEHVKKMNASRGGIHLLYWPLTNNDQPGELDPLFASSPSLTSLARRIVRDDESRRSEITINGEVWYAWGTPLKVADQYACLAILPRSGVVADLDFRWRVFLLVILLTLFVAALASWGVSRRFLVPVARVEEGVQAVTAGNLDFRMAIQSNDELGRLSDTFNEMVISMQEKERMSRYVSDFVLEEVKKDQGDTDSIGETMKATILFSDIRGFTTLSESQPPEVIVRMLNDYLERMTVVIKEHGGVVDKFIGDAVMAVFYPDPEGVQSADEERGLRAAMGMRDALASFNRQREERGLFTIDNGIGLNTGDVIKGSIGSRQHRVDLTVIGDNVNVAARLESMSREGRHTKIIISETTLAVVKDLVEVEPLAVSRVKGKSVDVAMYEVVRWAPDC